MQIERPDRPGGVLFDNLTALGQFEHLPASQGPGRHIVRRNLTENILSEASQWFSREALLRPLSAWPLPERLRFFLFQMVFPQPAAADLLFSPLPVRSPLTTK